MFIRIITLLIETLEMFVISAIVVIVCSAIIILIKERRDN